MISLEHYKEIIEELRHILMFEDDYASTRDAIRATIVSMGKIVTNKEES